jgi:hypothetical protein
MEYLIFAIFIALQIGDGWTTVKCIELDKGSEANPIVAWGIHKIGLVPALEIYKLFAIAVGYVLMNSPLVLGLVCLPYAYVVFNNYRILKA